MVRHEQRACFTILAVPVHAADPTEVLRTSLLISTPEVNAGDLLRVAADKVPVGACLARLAVVAVPPNADDGALLELLGR